MQWLIANIWMSLAAATVLGLLFGFSFRGLMVGARVRRAEVEREIARTELTQSKAEVEALYGAQRKRKEEAAQAVGGDSGLRAELDERETRITTLGDELSAARAELEQLKTAGEDTAPIVETVGAAAVGALAGAALSSEDSETLSQLSDRNDWLEQRVTALEADLSAAEASAPAAVAPVAETHDATPEKLRWQASYLRQRVSALEDQIIELDASADSASEPEPEPEPELAAAPTLVLAEAPEADALEDPAAAKETDEELARLRWRNRYLEGRLAYFEQAEDEADSSSDAELAATEQVELASPEPEDAELVLNEPDADSEGEAPASSEPAMLVSDEDQVHPSEAMLAELDGVRPDSTDQPSDGGQDLTAIAGIGPRIAEVLNELGIWTYAQIAAWLPEHETWIENHLAFKGRVSREDWIGQAKLLNEAA